ncbi:MAG: ROK family protein, partial [Planctomycetes bacterium]|nr:ROK family protein [Planctomycetota bacterium]
RITNDIERGANTVLRKLVRPKDTPKDILDHFGRAVAEGDEYALEVRELIADYIGRATAIAINCYDPDMLLLTGYVVMQCPEYLAQAAQKRISSDVFDHYSRDIEIVVERAGEESLIRGIATAVLNNSVHTM